MPSPAPVIRSVIEIHFEEASCCFEDLTATDETSPALQEYQKDLNKRLIANLEGLILAKEYSWSLCEVCLASEDIPPSEQFVVAFLAFDFNDIAYVKAILKTAFNTSAHLRATSAALNWRSWQDCRFWATQFAQSNDINRKTLAISAFNSHQQQAPLSVSSLTASVLKQNNNIALDFLLSEVITQANIEVIPVLKTSLSTELTNRNFSLICKCITLGDKSAIDLLLPFINQDNTNQEDAVAIAFKVLGESQLAQWFELLKKQKNATRLLLIAIGVTGNEQFILWVVEQMNFPEFSRLAGKTFSQLTNINLDEKGWTIDDSRLDKAWLEVDIDETLDWPDKSKIQEYTSLHYNH